MTRKPLELPPEVAKEFVEDMRAFFAETSTIKQDEIAARQLYILNQFRRSGDKNLRLTDVKRMFVELRWRI